MTTNYKIRLTKNVSHEVSLANDGAILLDGTPVELDTVRTGRDTWNVLRGNKSYNIRLIAFDMPGKKLTLAVNDDEFDIQITTELDELLSRMGMDIASGSKMEDVRAPMPGLVLKVLVEPGQEISEGDKLIILEAMKMENVIKATGSGTIARILVDNQDAVEKSQVLIEME